MPDETHEGAGPEALRRIEARLERASQAAERLIAEAAETISERAAAGRPPPAGWAVPGESPSASQEANGAGAGAPDAGETGASGATGDAELVAQVLQRLRELIPPELQRRLAEALRELLLALRALIDWYLERLERRRAQPAEVTDIPIL